MARVKGESRVSRGIKKAVPDRAEVWGSEEMARIHALPLPGLHTPCHPELLHLHGTQLEKTGKTANGNQFQG